MQSAPKAKPASPVPPAPKPKPIAVAAPTRKGAHPPHPKCPECGRALYKSMEPMPVKKAWPWAFCRYAGCKLHGRDQSKLPARMVLTVVNEVAP